MRIVIDMQGAQSESRFRGIGRYTLSFAQAIIRNRGEHEVLLVLNGLFPETIEHIRQFFDGMLPQESIRVWYAPGPVSESDPENKFRREVAELIREAFIASLQPDVIHISSLFEGYVDDAVTSIGKFDRITPVTVSLYDLIPLLNPEQYLDPNPKYASYYQLKIESINNAQGYLAISEFAKQEGLANLHRPTACFHNVSTAIDSQFQILRVDTDDAKELLNRIGIKKSFVLYAGGADVRKNLERLIAAFSALPARVRESHQLLFAGKMPESNIYQLKQVANSLGLNADELCFTGYITDEELIQLYNLCELFVFPSWHEGFGLPALEAMACGAPVIGANMSSLPEVIGLPTALFDPLDVAAISEKMRYALENEDFRALLRQHGVQQAQKFSWDETAKRSISTFEQLNQHALLQSAQKLLADSITKDLLLAVVNLAGSKALPNTSLLALSVAIAQNHPEARRNRKLFIDISELVQRDAKTGVQRVTRSILQELLSNQPEGYEVHAVYANSHQYGYFLANNFICRFLGTPENSVEDSLVEVQPGDIFLGLDLQHHTTRVQEPYLSQMKRNGIQVWFVVYDLLPIQFPSYWPSESPVDELHQQWLSVIIKFDGVICISKAVADELCAWLHENCPERLQRLKVEWFHLGADIQNVYSTPEMSKQVNDVLALMQAQPSFLMVGTLEPRKGHQQVFDAFEQLWNTSVGANLVIVGKKGWLVDSLVERILKHTQLGKQLFWLQGIDDDFLEKVYSASDCLIAASYGEGFGLPLIEAAQHKLPIIARDIPVFREVAGEFAYYFNTESAITLADNIKEWLMMYDKDLHPKSNDMPWLTWQESAAQLLKKLITKN